MQLKVSDQIESKVSNGELSGEQAGRFSAFVDTCNRDFMTHPVITDNKYCKWFASGAADRDIVRPALARTPEPGGQKITVWQFDDC